MKKKNMKINKSMKSWKKHIFTALKMGKKTWQLLLSKVWKYGKSTKIIKVWSFSKIYSNIKLWEIWKIWQNRIKYEIHVKTNMKNMNNMASMPSCQACERKPVAICTGQRIICSEWIIKRARSYSWWHSTHTINSPRNVRFKCECHWICIEAASSQMQMRHADCVRTLQALMSLPFKLSPSLSSCLSTLNHCPIRLLPYSTHPLSI